MYRPTQEHEEKRKKRLEKKHTKEIQPKLAELPHFLQRPWISLRNQPHTVKVMTWNLLAQCLVRSELFPTSGKARKANERIPMLHAEILSHEADILCMQEVDGLDKLLPVLDLAGYTYSYASGTDKPHGCLIAFKVSLFQLIHEAEIDYDSLQVRNNAELSTQACIGSGHQTKNIANIVALQSIAPGSNAPGYIIATTHLFWHPAYTYERARQAGLLVREVIAFQKRWQLHDWPCIIAGDFNFSPDDPAYSLVIGQPLSPEQQQRLHVSRVVHASIDPTISIPIPKEAGKSGGEEETDPDKVIRNSRDSTPSDGLLSDTELSSLVERHLRSAYDEGQRSFLLKGNDIVTYGSRKAWKREKPGACEPMWTSYTHHWQATLDYIFILDGAGSRTQVTGYLQPHHTEDVVEGLPQVGICGSDHFSLCVQLVTLPATLQ